MPPSNTDATHSQLTMREAAAIANTSIDAIQSVLDDNVLHTEAHFDPDAPRFSFNDALLFCLLAKAPRDLSVADKRGLCVLLRGGADPRGAWSIDGDWLVHTGRVEMRLALGVAREAVRRRMYLLRRSRERVVSRHDVLGGDPVFAGTRVTAYRVGALMNRGVPMHELREDFPHLSEEDFEIAEVCFALEGPSNRPRKPVILRYRPDEPVDRREPVVRACACAC